jgi:hypothetical protein
MSKTGNLLVVGLWLFVLLVTASTPLSAQNDVKVEATVTETQVFQGERINFNVVVSGSSFRNVGRPELPESIPGFRLLSSSPSTSTNFSIINGVANRSYSYVYTLLAETPGQYTIDPVQIQVDGESYSTNPVRLTVVSRSNAANTNTSERPDVFIRVELSERNPVVGQQITADLVLYFRSPLEIVSYQPSSNWVTDGFWKELMSDGSNPRAESVILEGERYRRAVLLKHALFPGRSGSLTVGEARVSVTVRNPSRYSDPFSNFFGGFGTNQRNIDLNSAAVPVTVRPLPSTSSSTIGAVGNFTISRRLSTPTATVGEAIEIITEIRGSGNLALISRPNYTFPAEFEVFTPQDETSINKESGTLTGSRTFRDVVIVRQAGEFTIASEQMAYYDPSRNRYVNISLPALRLLVNRDAQAVASSIQQRDLGIQPITGVVSWQPITQAPIWTRWWLWTFILIPLILIPLALVKKREDDRLRGDRNYARRVRALDRAMNTLTQAQSMASTPTPDVKQCMTLIQLAIYGLVSDRLGHQEAAMNDQKVIDLLKQSKLDDSDLRDIQKMLTKCSTIRFAPVVGRDNLTHEIDRAKALITHIAEVI